MTEFWAFPSDHPTVNMGKKGFQCKKKMSDLFPHQKEHGFRNGSSENG